jgi:hypothetical protein
MGQKEGGSEGGLTKKANRRRGKTSIRKEAEQDMQTN